MDAEFNISQELNTPIKKIKNLTLTSPFQFSPPNLYPSLNDLGTEMSNKGYSRKLTNNVLDELNARASEISRYTQQPVLTNSTNTIASSPTSNRRKRYSGIHRQKFNMMDSISSHYAATRKEQQRKARQQQEEYSQKQASRYMDVEMQNAGDPYAPPTGIPQPMQRTEIYSPNKGYLESEDDKREPENILSSVTKRRRTLHGPEEVLPDLQAQLEEKPEMKEVSSPIELNSSPIRRISPSKGSMNLNELLNDFTAKTYDVSPTRGSLSQTRSTSPISINNGPLSKPNNNNPSTAAKVVERQFLKPKPILRPQASSANSPGRIRVSSLEMAGVKSASSSSSLSSALNKKPSFNNSSRQHLPNTSTSSSALKAPTGTGIPTMSRKSSYSQLNSNNVSNSSMAHGASDNNHTYTHLPTTTHTHQSHIHTNNIPALQKKTSIPTLVKKPSIPKFDTTQSHTHNHSISRKSSVPRLDSANTGSLSRRSSFQAGNVTTPQPFSLYNKPTISSSQKSIETVGQTRQLKHKTSTSSLPPQKRTESRFSRFLNMGK